MNKSIRSKWAVHVDRMEDARNAIKFLTDKSKENNH